MVWHQIALIENELAFLDNICWGDCEKEQCQECMIAEIKRLLEDDLTRKKMLIHTAD